MAKIASRENSVRKQTNRRVYSVAIQNKYAHSQFFHILSAERLVLARGVLLC